MSMSRKYRLVRHGVDGYRRVARLVRTRVDVAVVFRQQVDVVEEVALMISSPVCLREANVEQHSAIETARGCLTRTNNVIQCYCSVTYISLLTSGSR